MKANKKKKIIGILIIIFGVYLIIPVTIINFFLPIPTLLIPLLIGIVCVYSGLYLKTSENYEKRKNSFKNLGFIFIVIGIIIFIISVFLMLILLSYWYWMLMSLINGIIFIIFGLISIQKSEKFFRF